MPLTLGEKLRQAREEQGISISEIAEQTRISPHYLECIEKNDFKTLPGGIFNKGFVKSFARYVGVNEAEAVQDYILAIGESDSMDMDMPRPYHPEVLTDDRTGSMVPTILFAVVILALMTGGILFVVRYLLSPSTAANQVVTSIPGNSSANANSVNANAAAPASTDKISVDLKAVSEPVWVNYSVDGVSKTQTLAPEENVKLEANEAFKISYSKAKLPNLRITVNGRQITPPSSDIKGNIEFEINRSNLNEMVQSGQPAPLTSPAAGNTATPSPTEAKRTPQPEKSKTPQPSPSPTSSGSPKPKPSPTVIVVGTPTRPRTAPTNRPN